MVSVTLQHPQVKALRYPHWIGGPVWLGAGLTSKSREEKRNIHRYQKKSPGSLVVKPVAVLVSTIDMSPQAN
jgi:hypothetical protein